jgi:hypothetical protein
MKKHKAMSSVVFEPKWSRSDVKLSLNHPLKYGEVVLYLGDMVDVPGHCAVATYDGRVILMIHPEELRKAKESEL